MLRDRHEPMDLFALVPKLGLEMDPILTEPDGLLDDDVVLPKVGRISPERQKLERQSWFRRGFRFRAGIEGRLGT